MEFTVLPHTLQSAMPTGIWYLIPLFFLAVVIKLHWFKSNAGEAMVNLSARFYLDRTWGECWGANFWGVVYFQGVGRIVDASLLQ